MFLPASFAVALLISIASTLCWGSFANTLKLARGYRFELYYWDYMAGAAAVSLLLAFTMGSIHGGPTAFVANLRTASATHLLEAVLAGAILNVANVLLIAGIAMVGLAVAYPVGVGIAMIEGVVLSYFVEPRGNAAELAAGLGLAVVAVVLIGKAYAQIRGRDTASSRKGVWVCVAAGLSMGIFAPLVTAAMASDHPLTPYSAAVAYTAGCLLCCLPFNTWVMRHPLEGRPVTFGDYRRTVGRHHILGLFGGLVWGAGNVFNLVGASVVGLAVSYAIGQASPMIAAAWGVAYWGEFRGANRRAHAYLLAMFVFYSGALIMIARAARG